MVFCLPPPLAGLGLGALLGLAGVARWPPRLAAAAGAGARARAAAGAVWTSTPGCGAGGGVISVTEAIGAVDAGERDRLTGVPGGTSTVTVTVWPVTSVTWNVRGSALAGSTAAPKPAVAMPAVASAISSLRVFMTCRRVPLPETRCKRATDGTVPAPTPERR